ncbi:MAG: GNAT family N-acetyltransferase [Pseudomonadota bacterium]
MTTLHTERLVLRPWQADDYPALAEFYQEDANARFVGGVKNADEAWRALAQHMGHWQLQGYGYFAVDERDTGEFVGCVGLWQSAGWPELELGYWVVPTHQGKGYALEAALCCRDYAHDQLKAASLVSYIDPVNEPSIRLAEKMGASLDNTIELLSYGPHRVYRHF